MYSVASSPRNSGILSRGRNRLKHLLLALLWHSGVLRKADVTPGARAKNRKRRASAAQKEKETGRIRLENKALVAERNRLRKLFSNNWSADDKIRLLRALHSVEVLSDRDLHACLSNLFAQRELDLVRLLVDDDSLGFDLVRAYHRLKLESHRCESASLADTADVYRRAQQSFLGGRIRQEYLIKAVKLGAATDVIQALSNLTDREFARTDRATIMGTARLCVQEKLYDEAVRVLRKYIRPNRPDQLLYFLEVLVELDRAGALQMEPALADFCEEISPVSSEPVLHYLAMTYQAVDERDQRNFRRQVIEPLSFINRQTGNLMDVRFSAEQKSALLERIRLSVIEKKPLSLLRLGDGEAYAYPVPQVEGIEPSLYESDSEVFERRWWGASPPRAIRDEITVRVRNAVARCDLLGLPSVYRIIRDLPPPRYPYGRNRNQRAFMRLFSSVGKAIPLEHKILTEERCQRCAIDAPFLVELATRARAAVVVSCWSEMETKFPGTAVEFIQIPPAKSIASGSSTQPFFEFYKETIECVRAYSGPGTVVYVGAGLIGKILVDEARQAGAVALDVGSLMDYMVGFKTRTVADVI